MWKGKLIKDLRLKKNNLFFSFEDLCNSSEYKKQNSVTRKHKQKFRNFFFFFFYKMQFIEKTFKTNAFSIFNWQETIDGIPAVCSSQFPSNQEAPGNVQDSQQRVGVLSTAQTLRVTVGNGGVQTSTPTSLLNISSQGTGLPHWFTFFTEHLSTATHHTHISTHTPCFYVNDTESCVCMCPEARWIRFLLPDHFF